MEQRHRAEAKNLEINMPRYILIDNNTGYIFGDTAEFAQNSPHEITPAEAARLLDESIGTHGRVYIEHASAPRTTVTGYQVYRADINGSEAVPAVWDGQDQETIDNVTRSCEWVSFVECRDAAE